MPRLGDLSAAVNAAARDWLTHAITINGRPVYAQGSYGDGMMPGMGSSAVSQDIELMVLKADWPTEPTRADVITSSQRPGRFFPTNVQTSDDGAHWIFELKRTGN